MLRFQRRYGGFVIVSQQPRVDRGFDEAVARLEKSGRLYLRRHRLPPEDAEDVLQETLLIFLIKHDEIYNPEAWLRGTLRKRCQFYWRRRQRNLLRMVDAGLLEAIAAAPAAQSPNENDFVHAYLDRALDTIPPRCRRLLKLRYGQDCDPQEAAAQLGYRPSGAYKIIERCLAALTRCLVATGFVRGSACEDS
jgi:RNA polymerase sigma factor (sigma-70 family)